ALAQGAQDRRARMAPGADDEGKAEPGQIARVQRLELARLLACKRHDAERALLPGGFGSDRAGLGVLPAEHRMPVEEGELLLPRLLPHHAHQPVVKISDRGEGTKARSLKRNPGSVLEDAAQRGGEARLV